MDHIVEIKKLRVDIDGIFTLCRKLVPSREISLAITSLELSKMWLGKTLKVFGSTNPYPESKNPSNEKIEPTADASYTGYSERLTEVGIDWNELSHIQKVKWLRAEIEKIECELFILNVNLSNRSIDISYDKCIEAGMWLGMELGRINNEANLNK